MKYLLIAGLVIILILGIAVGKNAIDNVQQVVIVATACAEGNSRACNVANSYQKVVSWTDENGQVITLSPSTPTPAAP